GGVGRGGWRPRSPSCREASRNGRPTGCGCRTAVRRPGRRRWRPSGAIPRRSDATIPAPAAAARSSRSATGPRDPGTGARQRRVRPVPRAARVKLARHAHRVRVPGFRFAGVRAGFKARGPDVALIALDRPGVAAGMLTVNRAPAAPVVVTRERLRAGAASAVLVHAGNANACTGREGRRTVEESTGLAAALLGVPA